MTCQKELTSKPISVPWRLHALRTRLGFLYLLPSLPFLYSPPLLPLTLNSVSGWSAEPIYLASPRSSFSPFLLLYHSALVFSSEVTLKGPRVMFLISALSRKSCQCIYQSNHHKPDVRVWFLSHFSLLDNLLISFPSSTRFILIKLLSAATQATPLGCMRKSRALTSFTP